MSTTWEETNEGRVKSVSIKPSADTHMNSGRKGNGTSLRTDARLHGLNVTTNQDVHIRKGDREIRTSHPEQAVYKEVIPGHEVQHFCNSDTPRPHMLDFQMEGVYVVKPLHQLNKSDRAGGRAMGLRR